MVCADASPTTRAAQPGGISGHRPLTTTPRTHGVACWAAERFAPVRRVDREKRSVPHRPGDHSPPAMLSDQFFFTPPLFPPIANFFSHLSDVEIRDPRVFIYTRFVYDFFFCCQTSVCSSSSTLSRRIHHVSFATFRQRCTVAVAAAAVSSNHDQIIDRRSVGRSAFFLPSIRRYRRHPSIAREMRARCIDAVGGTHALVCWLSCGAARLLDRRRSITGLPVRRVFPVPPTRYLNKLRDSHKVVGVFCTTDERF